MSEHHHHHRNHHHHPSKARLTSRWCCIIVLSLGAVILLNINSTVVPTSNIQHQQYRSQPDHHHHHHHPQQQQQLIRLEEVISRRATAETTEQKSHNESRGFQYHDPVPRTEQDSPHVVFGNLKYRRVCTTVFDGTTTLCMTIRFPFEVPKQDESVSYPFPVDDRFYQLTGAPYFIDYDDENSLEECQQRTRFHVPLDRRVYLCLEYEAVKRNNQVLVVFTKIKHHRGRQNNDGNHGNAASGNDEDQGDFFGTKSTLQQARVHQFFQDHDVVVIGDSLSPYVTTSVAELLEPCSVPNHQVLDQRDLYMDYTCSSVPTHAVADKELSLIEYFTTTIRAADQNNQQPRHRHHQLTKSKTDDNTIFVGNLWHRPGVYVHKRFGPGWHMITNETNSLLTELKNKIVLFRPSATSSGKNNKLRKLFLMIEFPIAHTQNQKMMYKAFDTVERNQKQLVDLIMDVTTPASRLELKQLGFDLSPHMMVFDGFPQHFPSATSGYIDLIGIHNETAFLQGNGYPGWRPEYGSTCRGPIPTSSLLTYVNRLDRKYFFHKGLDMRWYGKTWEFINQFWWEMKAWQGGYALDCTHPRSRDAGAPRVLQYFIQVMVDAYYESQQR